MKSVQIIFLSLVFFSYTSAGNHALVKKVNDRDGNVYNTIQIGNQVWMKENLRTKTPNSWCYEPFNAEKCAWEGRLYTWDDAIQACPEGWSLPDNSDWETLKKFAEAKKGKGTAGKALKEIVPFYTPDARQATDDFGFSAVLAGNAISGKFKSRGETGYYWSATDDDAAHAFDWIFSVNSDDLKMGNIKYSLKKSGFSVRCIQKEKNISSSASSITDSRDGRNYRVVKIGTQHWIAENLAFRTATSQCPGKDCSRGQIYTWTDAMQIAPEFRDRTFTPKGPVQGVCPTGFHLPDIKEWETLLTNIATKTSKEKAWINLLSKNEELLDFRLVYALGHFMENGSCFNLSERECAEKLFKPGDKNIKDGHSYYRRARGTDMFGFGATIAGAAYNGDAEDVGSTDYIAYWTSTDKPVEENFPFIYGNLGSRIGAGGDYDTRPEAKQYYLPVRCIQD